MRHGPVVLALTGALLVACAPDVETTPSTALGTSDLAPSMEPERTTGEAEKGDAGKRKPERPRVRARSGPAKPSGTSVAKPRDGRTTAAPSASAAPAGAQALIASVSDPAGDVRGSLTQAPEYVDLTGANLGRRTTFELRISFAGAVPARDDGDRIVNVASFYDLDGDGQVDYEVWASLSDNGWSGSYRTPSGARFGADSGVTARPAGDELVLTFPLAHLKGASAFRWSVGAEWGTYEQVAAGATAHDTAPDQGVVAFPG